MLWLALGDDGEFRVRTAIPIALASSFMSDRPAYCPYRAGAWAKPERRAHRLDRGAIYSLMAPDMTTLLSRARLAPSGLLA